MIELKPRQRAFLRSLAHKLKPVVHIGNEGVTDAVVRSVEDAFRTRELLKAKVQDGAPEGVRTTAEQVASRVLDVQVVQTIGRTMVLYRADPESPDIQLP